MRLQQKTFEIFADYHQFYLLDASIKALAPVDYTDEDVWRRIKVAPSIFVIQPERNMNVSVTVEVHDAEPRFNINDWDHIAEGSLHIPSGRLNVEECTSNKAVEFTVALGWYRVRSFHGGFDTIDETGLDGDDHYLAVLWPASPDEIRVIKQWPADRPG